MLPHMLYHTPTGGKVATRQELQSALQPEKPFPPTVKRKRAAEDATLVVPDPWLTAVAVAATPLRKGAALTLWVATSRKT